ncbi:MAG: Ppx/GppA phosphatase family protein, partial [Bacteroidota bacterium]
MTNPPTNAHPVKRIGAIDLGTNSFHAIIVDIYTDGSYRRIDELKEMAMLGQGGMKNQLSEEALERGIEALEKIKVLFDNHEVEKTLAYATSAIREARNGGEFIQRAIDEVGIKPRAIPGSMEAKLIGLAVQHALSLDESPVLMVDIGGGSVEFIIGNRNELFFHESYKIGSTRMTSENLTRDPATKKEIDKLTAIYKQTLSRVREILGETPVMTMIGSSGTMKNIAQMIAHRKSLSTSITLNELTFSAKDFRAFYKSFIGLNHTQRLKVEGLDKKRVDIILPGVVLVRYLLKEFGIKTIRISEDALREGMVIHYIKKKSKKLNLNADFPDPRRRSVFELLRKCDWHEAHSRHVTTTALRIFDHLQEMLGLDADDR